MPQMPYTIEGIAASRSTTKATGRATRLGAYWVMNSAMPTAIGTASSMATTELSTVVQSMSTMPKRNGADESTCHAREVKKLTLSSRIDGTAFASRKIAT